MLYVMCQYNKFKNKILSLFHDVIFLQGPLVTWKIPVSLNNLLSSLSKCHVYQGLQCSYIHGLSIDEIQKHWYMCMVCHEIHM